MLETEYKFDQVYELSSLLDGASDRVQFKNIFSTSNGAAALLAFKAGQKLDAHTAPAELMVYVVEGEIEFTVVNTPHRLRAGQFLLVGQGVTHSVAAPVDSKVLLVKVKA